MKQHVFSENTGYRVAILMKASAWNKTEIINNYVLALEGQGLLRQDITAFSLEYDAKKVSVAYAKIYLEDLMPELNRLGVTHILCTDANYFKLLVKEAKAEPHLGYAMPCKWPGAEHMHVALSLNYQQLIYNPDLRAKLDQSVTALASHLQGAYQAPGTGIIRKAIYPRTHQEVRGALEALMAYPELTCDIETFSLRFNEAGIGTVAFAVDEHRGVAFPCDYKENVVPVPLAEKRQEYGRNVPDPVVRGHLRWFFENYKGKLIFHNAGFDVKVFIYVLWMQHLLDTRGLLDGLEVMTRHLDDTKIIAYLATNSTAGNVLGLKALAQEFAGNYAVEEIKDIKLVPLPKLLEYNLVDALSTWYVHKKFYPVMVADNQEGIYKTLKLPTLKLILQIELTGMPMSKARVTKLKERLEGMRDSYVTTIRGNPIIPVFEDEATEREWEKDYQDRKAKAKNPDKIKYKDRATYPRFVFNPNSGPQLQRLLYEMLGLPIIDLTDTKLPATGAETLEKLANHTQDPQTRELIMALVWHGQVTKILNTFIPAFEGGISKDGSDTIWLHGSFNIGGTVSGRLSSSDPKQ